MLIVLALLGIANVLLDVIPPSQQPFLDYVAECRARGEPTSVAEYLELDSDALGHAAAVIAAPATEARVRREGAPWPWEAGANHAWLKSARPHELDAMRAQLQELAPFFDRLESASRGARLCCAFSWTNGDDPLVPALQSALRLLSVSVVADPTLDGRMGSIETMTRLSRLARGTTTRRMVGVAMMTFAVTSIRHETEPGLPDPTVTRARLEPLLSSERLDSLSEFVRAERIELMDTFTQLLEGRMVPDELFDGIAPVTDDWRGRRLLGLIHNGGTPVGSPEDCVRALEFLSEISSIDITTFVRWKQEFDRRVATMGKYSVSNWASIMPSRVAVHMARADAATRLARIALAAAEHRVTHGDFPATLDELKSMFPDGIPLDPYTDAPFVYETTPTGVRIASVGRLADEAALDEPTLRERCLVWELKR